MDRTQKTMAVGGAGIAVAVALGLAGASFANASSPAGVTTHGGYGYGGAPGGMHAGGTLSADAASRAVEAAAAEVDGGTVNGVRALADGTYAVHVTKSDGTHVLVLLDAQFAVTSVEERGAGRPGGLRGGHGGWGPGGQAPEGAPGTEGGSPTPSPSATSTSSGFRI